MKCAKAVAEARRKLLYHLSRTEGPDILDYAEGIMAEVWDMVNTATASSHTSETTADEWARRTAGQIISMWRHSGQHAHEPGPHRERREPGVSTSSGSGGGLVTSGDQAFALDPPEATPFGIFHAAYVWDDGTWSTRAEMCRMGYGHLLHGQQPSASSQAEDVVHEPDVAGGRVGGSEEDEAEDEDEEDQLGPDMENDVIMTVPPWVRPLQ